MKTIKTLILGLLILTLAQYSYAQEAAKTGETDKLKARAEALYKERKYDEALKIAQQIVQLKEKEFGAQHLETASAIGDVAIIEIAAGKMKDGEKVLRQAIAIYESNSNLTKDESLALAKFFEIAGFVRFKDKKMEEALVDYGRALEIKEKQLGAESLETARTLWYLANTYLTANDYQKAFESYEKVLKIRSANMDSIGYDEVYDALQRYECVAFKSGNSALAGNLIDFTEEKVKKRFKEAVVDGGIVNGKAKALVAPRYPSRPGFENISGKIEVRVTIDETGKVIFACALGGYGLFRKPSEEAALDTKFWPTLVNGKPVKVVGIIVYNFLP